MIKHETSLEEAKQIKELGFDFSSICEKFYCGGEYYIKDPRTKSWLILPIGQEDEPELGYPKGYLPYFIYSNVYQGIIPTHLRI